MLEIYDNGALTGYFVMEKGIDWGLDFAAELRTGDWHFQQFGTDKQVRRTAIAARCQSCHQSQAANDYMFTINRMRAYIPWRPLFLFRLFLDFLAVGLLLAALAYDWLGNAAHEVIGTVLFLLLIAHGIFNRRWYGTIAKGWREPRRAVAKTITLSF